jgi:hypothetical protein
VTRWVCEKFAQHVARAIFRQTLNTISAVDKSGQEYATFRIKQLPRVNNRPMGENSLNLVTLHPTYEKKLCYQSP